MRKGKTKEPPGFLGNRVAHVRAEGLAENFADPTDPHEWLSNGILRRHSRYRDVKDLLDR